MEYVLKLRGGVIAGRSHLEHRDPAGRVARGVFRPALGYELIEPIFALAADGEPEGRARFTRARDALALELSRLDTVFDIADVTIAPDTAGVLEIRIGIPDEQFWRT